MTVTTPRVRLRPLEPGDAQVYANWSTDPVFCQRADWTHDSGVAEHLAFWRTLIDRAPKGLLRLAAVVDGEQPGAADGEVVGYVDLHGNSSRSKELGFVVGPSERWGQGWGAAVARAGLDHGFTELQLDQVWAEAPEANVASIAILRSLGVPHEREGDEVSYEGQPSRYQRHLITREQWNEKRD